MSDMYCPNCNRAHTASGACRCVDPLGFSPERLARGEADAEAGRVRPLEEVMEALRARILESESAALAAAREEGRREGEAVIADLRRSADASHLAASNNAQRASEAEAALRAERAAHAAQLVALRETASARIPCVDCENGNRPEPDGCHRYWTGAWEARIIHSQARCPRHPVATTPLPDAEAALARVREEILGLVAIESVSLANEIRDKVSSG